MDPELPREGSWQARWAEVSKRMVTEPRGRSLRETIAVEPLVVKAAGEPLTWVESEPSQSR